MSECSICLGKHDPEIHEATRRVRKWLRGQITLGLAKVEKGKPHSALSTGMHLSKSDVGPAWEDRR